MFTEDFTKSDKANLLVPEEIENGKGRSNAESSVEMELTLEQAISKAMKNNPELKSSVYAIQTAMARETEARAGRFPMLSFQGTYAHWLDEQRLFPASFNGESGVFSNDLVSADLVLKMPLYTGGKIINGIKAAEFARYSAEHDMARTREELAFNLSSVFYQILSQKRLIAFLAFSKESLEGHLKRVNVFISAQKAANVDRLKMEVAIADVTQKLVRETYGLSVLHHILVNLMGMPPGSYSFAVQGKLEEPAIPERELKEADILSALEQREDYHALKNELAVQELRVEMARADHLPTIAVLGTYGNRWAIHPADPPAGSGESGDMGQIGLNIQMPLFEGGRTRARVSAEKIHLKNLEEKLRKLELQIRLEVESAKANLISAFERTKTLEKSMAQARESLRIEREKYELGKGTILDVLDAQSAMLEAETTYTGVLADYHIAKEGYRLALGGNIRCK